MVENPTLRYFVDSAGKLGLEELRRMPDEQFSVRSGILNLGMYDKPVWLKLRLKNNNSELERWVINFTFPLVDTVTIYQILPDKTAKVLQHGEMFATFTKYYDNKNISLPLDITYGEIQTIYVKIKTDGVVYLPFNISSEEAMYDMEKKNYLFYGLFYGAALLILIYNLLLFFTLKDGIYLLYCFYVLVVIGILSYFNGFISYLGLFNEDRTQLNKLFSNIVFNFVIISTLFCYYFLEIKKQSRMFSYILKTIVVLGVLCTVLSFFIKYQITIRIASIAYIITPFMLLYISCYSWFKGNYTARFYSVASSLFLISVLLMSLRVMGVITGSKSQETLIELGVITDAVLISLALADKLRKLRMEKERSQQRELLAIAEKERLIIEQNSILEDKISSRTKEIVEKNEQLEQFSLTIQQQNGLLKEYTENLEMQIQARTREILETNRQLARKTDRLEQFTYIVSHNLKSPVNNLNALLGFIDMEALDPENKEYFGVIKKTSDQLSNIIDEISILVKLDKGTDIEYGDIHLLQVIDNIKDKLIMQIESSGCTIKTALQVETIRSFAPYITSILYNLISNAIKYRSDLRPLEITVHSQENADDSITLTVEDNGNGIAADHIEHVFKLFYRINHVQEGKGMGLFIVKSQVELLDGKINVTSTVGLGTSFIIELPKK